MQPLFVKIEFLSSPTAFVLMTVAYTVSPGHYAVRYGQYSTITQANVEETIRNGFSMPPQRAAEYFPELNCRQLIAVKP